jgi:hypothetical protein
MIILAAPLQILPKPPIFLKAVNRPRVRITFVKVPDLISHAR